MKNGGRNFLITLGFTLMLLGSRSVLAAELFLDFDRMQNDLGFTPYYSLPPAAFHPVKVAILDHGFRGYQSSIGKTLPVNTQYHAGPMAPRPGTEFVEHGRAMAEIFTQLVSDQGRSQTDIVSELHLYNVAGFTNFKAAIDDVIARKVDVVLYSEVWPIGGNSDGRGFINREVNRATSAGVIWINAAGNFQTRTFEAKVETGFDGYVKLPDQDNSLEFICEIPENVIAKACRIQIHLLWNDFKDQEGIGTDNDLDLELLDKNFQTLKVSRLKQTTQTGIRDPQLSNYPRETISGEFAPGRYFLRVKKSNGAFSSQNHMRVLLDGDFVSLPSYTVNETILNPADNSSVVTVGASDSDRSSRSVKLNKPDLLAPSSLVLNASKAEYRGSSNSAAIVAAGFAIHKSLNPNADRATLLREMRRSSSDKEFSLPNPVR